MATIYEVGMEAVGSGAATLTPPTGKTIKIGAIIVQFTGTGQSGTVTLTDLAVPVWSAAVSGAGYFTFVDPISALDINRSMTASCPGATVKLLGAYEFVPDP